MIRQAELRGTLTDLSAALQTLDGRGYREYRSIKGRYRAPDLELQVDHVQGDPFSHPSRVRIGIPADAAELPVWALASGPRLRAAADFFHRILYDLLKASGCAVGSGRGGELDILRPGQQVLERSAVILDPAGSLEVRMGVGLPGNGRRIMGAEAAELLAQAVPQAIRGAVRAVAERADDLRAHVEAVEDAVHLRTQLTGAGLVAFVADGSLLPRASGVDDAPLGAAGGARPFSSPRGLAVELEAPNAGRVRGLGIPHGVTLIVGGGYHGKSTLLRALERGVYDHVPGDGRERVVAVTTAVKVRAEDGRSVAGTDISAFIGTLPGGGDSARFVSGNASGSTSQAASIVEALEAGATCLLLDEDTSAANFLIRDARMQRLIATADEPITAFVDRARALYEERGVSTVMVVGGSGDYFDVADTVVAMRSYEPSDVTARAHEIARELPSARTAEGRSWGSPRSRAVCLASLDPRDARGRTEVRLRSGRRVLFGREEVDASALEQVVEPAQLEAIARALVRVADAAPEREVEVGALLRETMETIEREGLDAVQPEPMGNLASFRVFELAGFLNRIRTLRGQEAPGTRVAPAGVAADHSDGPAALADSPNSFEV